MDGRRLRAWVFKERRRSVDMTDARPAADLRRRVVEDPEAERKRRLGIRAFAIVLAVVGLVGSVAAVFGEGGYFDLRRLHREIAALQTEVEGRRLAVRVLENERDRMQADPLARERIARERLGLIKKGEIDFLLPRSGSGTNVDRRLGG